ncbi:MAG: hypothetical protein K0U13_00405 [Chlamydiae bacterium]|nr:hypothetical protein [Chlamydiota bacterium]
MGGLANEVTLSMTASTWGAPKDGMARSAAKTTSTVLIVIGTVALTAELVAGGLLIGRVIPMTSRAVVWARGLTEYQLYVVGSFAAVTLVTGLAIRFGVEKLRKREFDKQKRLWIAEQTENETPAFKVGDSPSMPGTRWETAKPRVVVFFSNGGGGHKSAAKAVARALDARAQVTLISVDSDAMTTGVYNRCQKRDWIGLQKVLVKGQGIGDAVGAFHSVGEVMVRTLYHYKPQLVISVQPIGNSYIHDETAKLNIPFWVLGTDYYSEHFLTGVSQAGSHLSVGMMLPSDEEERARLEKRGVTNILEIGALLPPPFQGDQHEINNEMGQITQVDGKVITICMGGAGSPRIKTICEKIKGIQFNETVHVFALCAKMYDKLKDDIRALGDNFHPIGYVDGAARMGAYIKRADVYITKPGGGSTSEGIATGTQLFFVPGTSFWEEYNCELATKRGWGRPIKKATFESDLKELLAKDPLGHPNDFPGLQCDQNLQTAFNKLQL